MKKLIFYFLLAMPLLFSFSDSKITEITCPTPTNGRVTFKSSGSISFEWDDCSCTSPTYKIWYHRSGDNYTSPEYSTNQNYYNFTNLPAGKYTFYYKTVCVGGESNFVVIEDEDVM